MNKRGLSNEPYLLKNTIFIILNLVFISMLLYFVSTSANGARFYEEGYAKKIAFIIDESKPGMTIAVNIDGLIQLAQKNGLTAEKIIQINSEESSVTVCSSEKSCFIYTYFRNYNIEIKPSSMGTANLVFEVKEK